MALILPGDDDDLPGYKCRSEKSKPVIRNPTLLLSRVYRRYTADYVATVLTVNGRVPSVTLVPAQDVFTTGRVDFVTPEDCEKAAAVWNAHPDTPADPWEVEFLEPTPEIRPEAVPARVIRSCGLADGEKSYDYSRLFSHERLYDVLRPYGPLAYVSLIPDFDSGPLRWCATVVPWFEEDAEIWEDEWCPTGIFEGWKVETSITWRVCPDEYPPSLLAKLEKKKLQKRENPTP